MRKLVALSMVLTAALLMGGCGLGKMVKKYPEVTVTLDNPDLENKGGEVAYTIKGTIPPKYMKKKATMTFTPSLSVDGEKVTPPFAIITLKGEKAKGDGITIPYKTGGTFTKSGTFKFDEKYETADIVVGAEANLKKKHHDFGDRNLGEGISNTSARANLTPRLTDNAGSGTAFLLAPHNYKAEFIGRTATLYFDLNSANMNWSNPNNKTKAAKDSIKEFIDFMGTGTPDMYIDPWMLNKLMQARDRNGRRIRSNVNELASELNVGSIHRVQQFKNRIRTDSQGNKHKLLCIIGNMKDYGVGSTKGGEITHFTDFDIRFNQLISLIETRLSGATMGLYSFIVIEEPVATTPADPGH